MPPDKVVSLAVVRKLREQGRTQEEIAERFGVHRSTVSRMLQAPPDEGPGPAEHALEELLDTLELDALGRMRAAIALGVAAKLDTARAATSGTIALAVPALSKELRAVVAELMDVSEDDKTWLADVFAPVGDPEDART